MNYHVMGGPDGPTAVFLAGRWGGDYPWFAIFGLITLLLLFLPNIVSRIRRKQKEINLCENRLMNLAQEIGGLLCLFIMLCWVGYGGFGFYSVGAFLCYIYGSALLVLIDWVLWIIYYFVKRPKISVETDGPTAVFIAGNRQILRGIKALRAVIAAVPALLFLLHGLTLHHWLLAGCAAVYGIGNIYVTYENINMRVTKATETEKGR